MSTIPGRIIILHRVVVTYKERTDNLYVACTNESQRMITSD